MRTQGYIGGDELDGRWVGNFVLADPIESAFVPIDWNCMGLDVMKWAYEHAVRAGYRFYSYGDASLLLPDCGS